MAGEGDYVDPGGHVGRSGVDVIDRGAGAHAVEEPAAGYTLSEVPITTKMSASATSSVAGVMLGTASWKNTMWGRTRWPSITVSGVVSMASGQRV